MIPVLDSRQMARADRMAVRTGIASGELMENAAVALTRELLETFPGARSVVVACGPGNNGGDGLAAARMLDGRGLSVSVFTLGDPSAYGGDAADNAQRARQAGLALSPLSAAGTSSAFRRTLAGADVVVDALFGTGLSRPLTGGAARAVSAMAAAARPVVAADIPSGLSADSGDLIGPCVPANVTVAFAAPKRVHVLFPARGRCGRVTVADIGISRQILGAQESRLRMTERADIAALFPPRPADSHKGTFGRLAIVAGSAGKAGASILAACGALRAGAGLVTVFCPSAIAPLVVGALPETMTRGLPDRDGALAEEGAGELLSALADFDAVVAGPGLTTAPGVAALLERLLQARLALVCDADALNTFSGRLGIFARRRAPTVLTPHPGEAGRLLGVSGREVQKDRIAAAARLARRSGAVTLLKGASSLIAAPSGRLTVNLTGTPLMATAGSGDVLSGAIGAFLAGGMGAEDAAIAGAYMHGAAGERLARDLGDAGLLAHELADALPLARRELRSGNGKRETGNE